MKIAQPKRIKDQLGRPGGVLRIHLLSLAFFATLFGSVWPASARSLDPAYDTLMNSLPLSVLIDFKRNGNLGRSRAIASTTRPESRTASETHSVHPDATSVAVSV